MEHRDGYQSGDTKPKICVDFDGVLHSYVSGWTGTEPADEAVSGAREFVHFLMQEGFAVYVLSCRARDAAGVAGMERWLSRHGFPPGITVTVEKPHAELYVDDKGLRFEGDFADIIIRIRERRLTPWNQAARDEKRRRDGR